MGAQKYLREDRWLKNQKQRDLSNCKSSITSSILLAQHLRASHSRLHCVKSSSSAANRLLTGNDNSIKIAEHAVAFSPSFLSMFLALVNGLVLSLGPFFAVYYATDLHERSSISNILMTVMWFVLAGVGKIFLGSVFLPTTEGVFSPGEEFVNTVLGVADFFGIYFAEKYIGGAIDVRVPIIGWAWGLCRALTDIIVPVWEGSAKGSIFAISLLARCLGANTEMMMCYAAAVSVWYLWKSRRSVTVFRLVCPATFVAYLIWPTAAKLLEPLLTAWGVLATQTLLYSALFFGARRLFDERPKY